MKEILLLKVFQIFRHMMDIGDIPAAVNNVMENYDQIRGTVDF